MSEIRLDQVIMTGLFEMWQNVVTETRTMNISGSIPNGGSVSFVVEFPMPEGFSIADIYAESPIGKTYVNNAPRATNLIFDFRSTENTRVWVTYQAYTDPTVFVTVYITQNTGSTLNLINQSIDFTAVFYRAPIMI